MLTELFKLGATFVTMDVGTDNLKYQLKQPARQ